MTTTNADKRADLLRKVRGLLAKAESTGFEGEADVFRAKAEELMLTYAIESYELTVEEGKPTPEKRDYDISWYYNSPVSAPLWSLAHSVARHCRVIIVTRKHGYSGNYREIPIIGLPADLDYFDLLFTSLQLQYSAQLTPKVSDKIDLDHNIALLKEAGMKWPRVDELLAEAGFEFPTATGQKARNVQLRERYKKHCASEGRVPVRANPETYARSFAEGFVMMINQRLDDQLKAAQAGDGSGTSLVLRDIYQDVKAAVFEFFPDMKPHASDCDCQRCKNRRKPTRYRGGTGYERVTDYAAMDNGAEAGKRADLTARPGHRVRSPGSIGGGS